MTEELLSRPLYSLTVGEFLELQKSTQKPVIKEPEKKKYVFGIAGLATMLNCSISTAQRIKNEGTIDKAIYQTGKKIVVDVELALKLLTTSKVKL